MKKKTYIIIAVVFIAVIAAAAIGYNILSENYDFSDNNITDQWKNDHDHDGKADEKGQTKEERQKAPDFTVKNESGEDVSLSELEGKPVIINFWATWCGPCRSEFPHFDKMYDEYGDEINFMMVNLTDGSRDTVENVKAFVEENGYAFPVYYDTEYDGADKYGAYSIPLTVFIDSEGNYLGQHTGAMDESTLSIYIEALRGE